MERLGLKTRKAALAVLAMLALMLCLNAVAPQNALALDAHSYKPGWHIINGKLYYVTSKHHFKTSGTYKCISFTSSGAAKDNVNSQLKIKCMRIVDAVTTSSMSRSQRLRAVWNYVTKPSRFRYAMKYPSLTSTTWTQKQALNLLTTKSGNCYSFACAFAYLAYEVGYNGSSTTPYVICGRIHGSRDGAADGFTRHAWVRINGRYYDPEEKWVGVMSQGYAYGQSSYPWVNTVTGKVRAWSRSTSSLRLVFSRCSNGLHTYNGKLYYVRWHNPLRSTWKRVGSKTYYFGSSGAAASTVCKSRGKYYAFNSKHQLLKGSEARLVKVNGYYYCVLSSGRTKAGWSNSRKHLFTRTGRVVTRAALYHGKLYAFSSTGRYDSAKTVLLRDAIAKLKVMCSEAADGADMSLLTDVLGKPGKVTYADSCNAMSKIIDGEKTLLSGEDGIWKFGTLTVYTFKCSDGTEYLQSVE